MAEIIEMAERSEQEAAENDGATSTIFNSKVVSAAKLVVDHFQLE